MKNAAIKLSSIILFTALVSLTIESCIDPMYDLSKGINPEISVGGDSLGIALGKLDTIFLGDFLSSEDQSFLKTLGDGGYGMTISDSMSIEDLLKDLDVSKLKFDDQVFAQNTKVDFGDIDVSEFVIPGFTQTENLDMNIPSMELGDVVPSVDINKDDTVRFSDYALDETKLKLADIDDNKDKTDDLLAGLLQEYSGDNPIPIPIPSTQIKIGELSVTINYSIDVPEGISTIHQIDLESGAKLEIELALGDASDVFSGETTFTPNITIDPTDLFKFKVPSPLLIGKFNVSKSNGQLIELKGENNKLSWPNYKTTKTLDIDAFHNLPNAVNKLIEISKQVNISGEIAADGKVEVNKLQKAKEIDLVINVRVKGVKIRNMDFEIPDFVTPIDGTSVFTIENNSIPEDIKTITIISLGKTDGSPLPKNLVINIKPSNLPEMKTSSYKIDNLSITFPNNFVFDGMVGQTFTATNATLDPVTGYSITLDLEEIDMSQVPITNQILSWQGDITYNGQISIGGRMNSDKINTSADPLINLKSESAIKVESVMVETNQIDKEIQVGEVALEYEIDIADKVARLGTVNVQPGSYLTININKPNMPLELRAKNLTLKFSDLYEFKPDPNLNNNEYIINGNIPDFIQLELKALHINQNLDDGFLSLKDTFNIAGSIILLPGTALSTQIEALQNEKLSFEAIVSDVQIESTSIEMKTLEANYQDSTVLDMAIDDIPSEIVALDSITLKPGAELELDITINNMPDLGTNPLDADITISFPDILKFESGAVNSNNELIIREAFVDGKLSKKVNLKGLKFDGSDLNGSLTLDDKVNFDVNVSVSNPTINSEDLQGKDISVDVNVALKNIEFKSVYGKFNVDFGDKMDIPNLTLDDLPDFMKGDDVVLDILNPVLALSTESNIGIPIDATLSLTNYKNGNALTDNKINLDFSLPKSESPNDIRTTSYWYSPSESGMPTGYTFMDTNIQDLFKPIPDSVKISFNPIINTGYQHLIDLTAKYNLKVKYDITIPFNFGKDLSIVLKDTLEDVSLDLGDIDINTGALEITAKITNSIPLDLRLEMLMVDKNLNILSAPEPQTIWAGAPDGSGVESTIQIRLADSLKSLKDMDKIILVFKATSNSTVAGTPIRPENFVIADLKARIIGGIKIKLPI